MDEYDRTIGMSGQPEKHGCGEGWGINNIMESHAMPFLFYTALDDIKNTILAGFSTYIIENKDNHFGIEVVSATVQSGSYEPSTF